MTTPAAIGSVLGARRLPGHEAGLGDAVGAAECGHAEAGSDDLVHLDRQRGRAQEPEGRIRLGRARLGHLGPVHVVRQQIGHGAERRGDGGARPVHLGPELRHREAPVDRAAATEEEGADDHRGQGIEVVHRQRRPHDVVRRPAPADADLACQGLVVVVAEHAALGEAGRAAGVDEGSEVGGIDVDGGRRQVTGQDLVPAVDGGPPDREVLAAAMPVLFRLVLVVRIVHHDHVFEVGCLFGDRHHPRQQAGCDHQHACARVGQLVGQVLALVGGVHRDRDPSRGTRCRPRPTVPPVSSRATWPPGRAVGSRAHGVPPRSEPRPP